MHYKEVKSYPVDSHIINMEELLERVDQDYELLEELFQVFIEDLPAQLQEIEKVINQGDCERLRILAHRLKGSMGNLSAAKANELAMKMEMAAGQGELETVQYIYPDLVMQTHLVMEALESMVRSGQF